MSGLLSIALIYVFSIYLKFARAPFVNASNVFLKCNEDYNLFSNTSPGTWKLSRLLNAGCTSHTRPVSPKGKERFYPAPPTQAFF